MGRKEAMAKAAGLLETLGLGNRLEHRPNQLSGANASVRRWPALLSMIRASFWLTSLRGALIRITARSSTGCFFSCGESTGKTFIIVTHDESLAGNSDRVVHMADGRIVL